MQKMFKKGDLSMSTIVMAVIAVLIMVILIAMVMRNLGGVTPLLDSCVDKGGKCSYESCSQEEYVGYRVSNPAWTCLDSSGRVDGEQRCCVRG